MKRILLSLVAIATISLSSFGQAPEGFKYQAVVRDAGNLILNNQAVGMQLTIQQGSIGGTPVYQETFAPTTNAYGLVNLEIGNGTVVSGTFATIDWAAGPYFIETAVDVTGGTSYAAMGTSQLMSVPYALYANTAENVINDLVDDADSDPTNELQDWNNLPGIPANIDIDATDDFSGDYNDLTNQPTIPTNVSAFTNDAGYLTTEVDGSVTNEIQTITRTGTTVTLTNGGTFTDSVNTYTAGTNITISASNVISANSRPFHLGKDTLGGIVYYIYIGSDGNQHGLIVNKTESTAAWQATGILTNANRTEDGTFNTALMSSSAAATYATGLGAGWYLPSIDELALLYYNRFTTNKALRTGGFTLLSNSDYWSSTEDTATNAFHFDFYSGLAFYNGKSSTLSVRAVRAF